MKEVLKMTNHEMLLSDARVVGFNGAFCFELGHIAVAIAEEKLVEGQTYAYNEVLRFVYRFGNTATVNFFNNVGCGEIDIRTGLAGEVIRFRADSDTSVVAEEGSNWSWLKY